MEGLRSLALKDIEGKRAYPWCFDDDSENSSSVYQVWPRVDGLGAVDEFYVGPTENAVLAEFLERGISAISPYGPSTPAFSSAGVKVVFSWCDRGCAPESERHSYYGNKIQMPRVILENLADKLDSDPLSISMFDGYHAVFEQFGGLADGGVAAIHLRTPRTRFMWSTRQHEKSSHFDTRCIAIVGHGYNEDAHTESTERRTLLECMEAFKQDVHSPLYFPFVISVHASRLCRILLNKVEAFLAYSEHAKGDRGSLSSRNSDIPLLQRFLLATATTLDSIEMLYDYLEVIAEDLPPSARSEKVLQSTNNILCAVQFQRKAMRSLREGLRLAERRVRSEVSCVSWLYSLITLSLRVYVSACTGCISRLPTSRYLKYIVPYKGTARIATVLTDASSPTGRNRFIQSGYKAQH